jgi:hypothetical protein
MGAALSNNPNRRGPWLIVIAVVLVVACGASYLWVRSNGMPFLEPEHAPALYVRNDRPHVIKIRIVDPSGETMWEIPAGGLRGWSRRVACDATLIEAQDENGQILTHVNGGGCSIQTWVVNKDGSANLVPGRVERPK